MSDVSNGLTMHLVDSLRLSRNTHRTSVYLLVVYHGLSVVTIPEIRESNDPSKDCAHQRVKSTVKPDETTYWTDQTLPWRVNKDAC